MFFAPKTCSRLRDPPNSAVGRRRHGFTAIEALLATTILAIITAAVSGALAAGRAQSQLARDTLIPSMLGQALMDEIMRLPFNDPQGYTTMGPDPGETTRTMYDNIDDYSGYTDGPGNVADSNGVLHPITDLAGNAYSSDFQPFVRSVTMSVISASPTGWNRTVNGLLITVTVSFNGQNEIVLQRIAWN